MNGFSFLVEKYLIIITATVGYALEDSSTGLSNRVVDTIMSEAEEERHEILFDKRQIVQTLVDRVRIGKDRDITVIFRLSILEIVKRAGKISVVPRA